MRHRTPVVSATVAAVFAVITGPGLLAAPPAGALVVRHSAGALVAREPVDGLVQVRWEMGVDTFSMSGTYTTSSQLGQGTVEANSRAPAAAQFVFVRSDGMQLTGQASSVGPNIFVNLTGTSDIRSATLTLTELSITSDPGNPHAGDAEFHLQGSIDVTTGGCGSQPVAVARWWCSSLAARPPATTPPPTSLSIARSLLRAA